MAEEGTLSIVRRGSGYQVRYASNHPYDPERPPHACDDEQKLIAFLHHLGLEAGAIRQARSNSFPGIPTPRISWSRFTPIS